MSLVALVVGASLTLGAGCSSELNAPSPLGSERQRVSLGELRIDTGVRRQRITGFGASSAWVVQSVSKDVADLLFSPEKGIGLSLLRLHINPDGTTNEMGTARTAHERGVAVWAAPWSPPGAWKTTGTDNYGGTLLPEYYEAWANRLSSFARGMADAGVPLVALSSQNEPNWVAEWETCEYTPAELTTFVRDYLGPALRRDSPGTKLMAPEAIDWITIASYADALLDDAGANAELGIVAVHAYGGTPWNYTAPAEHGKEFWETEISYDDFEGMAATLETAREVHKHLVIGNVNAFHYWWLISETTAGLMKGGELTPQAYGLGHYSRFIRPGYERLEMLAEPSPGLVTSAYVEPSSGRTVIVAVNSTENTAEWTLRVEGGDFVEVTPWVTTEASTLERAPSFAFTSGFDYAFAPRSVTTLIVSGVETPPAGEGGEGGAPGASGAGWDNAGGEAGDGSGGANEAGETSRAGGGGTSSQAGKPGKGGEAGEEPEPRGGTTSKPHERGGTTSDGGSLPLVPDTRRPPTRYTACAATPGSVAPSWAAFVPLVGLLALGRRRRPRA